ncbi:hypothetical protein HPB48_015615 [Haemaphysalis longicornis]|uniref:Uncharacterized protein n=1 Tax=Haemaphysalis longicornis TaxID=44386 RepID=A0A9J6FI30_HAELO|nr:hypothetical protein HPB48_015615 [Haemaphysalis longicornis]
MASDGQLELMGAVVEARMIKYLRTSWDSLQFVRNIIIEITTLTNPESWRYCPGEDNPADLLTRGVSVNTLRESRTWWTGPEWL